jgi:nuclease S1
MQKAFSLLGCVFICLVTITANAQQTITPASAKDYVGQKVTVCGSVTGTYFDQKARRHPTFINFGPAYPNSTFSLLIWGNDRKKFSYQPEEYLKNKQVCVTGTITTFKGRVEMIVTDSSQINTRVE